MFDHRPNEQNVLQCSECLIKCSSTFKFQQTRSNKVSELRRWNSLGFPFHFLCVFPCISLHRPRGLGCLGAWGPRCLGAQRAWGPGVPGGQERIWGPGTNFLQTIHRCLIFLESFRKFLTFVGGSRERLTRIFLGGFLQWDITRKGSNFWSSNWLMLMLFTSFVKINLFILLKRQREKNHTYLARGTNQLSLSRQSQV